MVPSENVIATYFACLNWKRELIAVASVREEQQAIEGHVEFFEVRIVAKLLVVPNDAFKRPDDRKTIFIVHAICFKQAIAKLLREADT